MVDCAALEGYQDHLYTAPVSAINAGYPPGTPFVATDNFKLIELAYEHVVGVGLRRFAFNGRGHQFFSGASPKGTGSWLSSAGRGALDAAPSVLDRDVLLVSDSNAAYRYFAQDARITHRAVNLRAGIRVDGAIHVQNVNAYHSRLRGWLHHFNGVATHYLPNYLVWRWAIDAKRIDSSDTLLRGAIGVFHN